MPTLCQLSIGYGTLIEYKKLETDQGLVDPAIGDIFEARWE